MVGFASDRCTVTSWGWLNEEGTRDCTADTAAYRLWSVLAGGERRGFIALPVDTEPVDVMLAASAMLDMLDELTSSPV